MKKTIPLLATALMLLTSPAFAGEGHAHDDHSKIQALAIEPEAAVLEIETGLTDLGAKIEAQSASEAKDVSLKLMSAIKTLEEAKPSERQASALKQLNKQIDDAKHAAEEKDFKAAKSAATKAQSALKLYKAVK